MPGKKTVITGAVMGALLSASAWAVDSAPFTAADRDAVVQALAVKLKANYVIPAKDEGQRADLQCILAMVEKGETEAPDYSVRKN